MFNFGIIEYRMLVIDQYFMFVAESLGQAFINLRYDRTNAN